MHLLSLFDKQLIQTVIVYQARGGGGDQQMTMMMMDGPHSLHFDCNSRR